VSIAKISDPLVLRQQLVSNSLNWSIRQLVTKSSQVASSNSASSTRTLYVQNAPNSNFATISHVPRALALDLANVLSVEYRIN